MSEVYECHLHWNKPIKSSKPGLNAQIAEEFLGSCLEAVGWEGKKKQCHNQNGF
jgi:hypothetical protein